MITIHSSDPQSTAFSEEFAPMENLLKMQMHGFQTKSNDLETQGCGEGS